MNQTSQLSTKRILGVIAVIAVIIVVFLLLVDMQEVLNELETADPVMLLLGSAAFIAGLAAFAARWRALLNYEPSFIFTFHASNMGQAGNILLPARAGEAIRILVMGTDEEVSLAEATASFVVERLFEQVMRLLAILAAVLVGVGLKTSLKALIGGVVFVIAGFAVVLWLVNHPDFTLQKGAWLLSKIPRVSEERARQATADLLQNLSNITHPRRFAVVFGWSLVSSSLFWLFFFLTLRALDTGLPLQEQIAVSLGALALSPPSAATQPGLFHASVVAPLAAVGFDAELVTAYAVLLHIIEMVWLIILASWGLFATKITFSELRDLFQPDPDSETSTPAP
ncbi:MAG: lysylphosphatidylglycerol synthase transmembrane domain-containing protein [Candidatus Promineifilaceae bacterium]